MEFNPTHFITDGTPCEIVADVGEAGVVIKLQGFDPEWGFVPVYRLVEYVYDKNPLVERENRLKSSLDDLEKAIAEKEKYLSELGNK